MIDLNSFKKINDNYGHSEGDAALVRVADLLRKSFSEYGVVTRYAGDEFVIILNTTDAQLVQSLIEKAKQKISNQCQAEKTFTFQKKESIILSKDHV